MDGVFTWSKDSRTRPKFYKTRQPTNEEVEKVVSRIRHRSLKILVEIGKLSSDADGFTFGDQEEEMDEHGRIKMAAIRRRIALGSRAGELFTEYTKPGAFWPVVFLLLPVRADIR